MGSEEDPQDGGAVAGAVFGAVFIYIVCIPRAM
jgi:ribonuclease kappa